MVLVAFCSRSWMDLLAIAMEFHCGNIQKKKENIKTSNLIIGQFSGLFELATGLPPCIQSLSTPTHPIEAVRGERWLAEFFPAQMVLGN